MTSPTLSRAWLCAFSLVLAAEVASAQEEETAHGGRAELEKVAVSFAAPVRLKGGGAYVRTEAPGYAAPCWHDVDGDGTKDLVVGQFAGGKMMLFRGAKDGTFGERTWIQAAGDVAEVPGVW